MTTSNTIEMQTKQESRKLKSPQAFQTHLEGLNGAPEWLIDLKKSNWEKFNTLPAPVRKNESWRFAKTDKLSAVDNFEITGDAKAYEETPLLEASRYVDNYTGKLVLADDQKVWSQEISEELKAKGVIFATLHDAIREHGDLLEKYFMVRTPDLGSEKYQALHAAFVTNGTFLYVPRGVEIDLPFVIRHWACGENLALFPHTLIVAEDNAKVSLVDVFQSDDTTTRHLTCAMASIFAGAGSQVFYKAAQDWNLSTLSFHLNTVTAERDSNVRTVMLNIGSKQSRNEQHTRIIGSGSNVENYSLSVPTGDQEFDQRTLQTHTAPNSRSDLLYKNALFDDARTIFSGLIKVEEEAQQTDAYQTNRNLLLSDTAEANALPGLEILANDVKCSHGATTGRLAEDEVFYFLARGIPRRVAQQLLVFGFFEEIIDKLDNNELKDNLRHQIHNKFHD